MIAVIIALVLGAIVSVAYVWSLVGGVAQARREMSVHGGADLGEAQRIDQGVLERQEVGLFWKSAAGVGLSILAIALIAVHPALWYVLPFLSLGTALAVVAAFAIDRVPAATPGRD
jgi:hypothetical protein